jgi:PAS domain S-box-containing protein
MEESRKVNDIFEIILQGITDPVLLLSKDLKVLWANKAFQDQTGFKSEEIIGNYCYRLTHRQESPCQLPYDLCPIPEAEKTGKTAATTHTHFDKEGNKIFVQVSAYPVKDDKGDVIQFVYMYRDITEIKRIEESLRDALTESRQRQAEISALLEGSRAVLKYFDFNSAARAIFDSCKNLIGATSGYIALLSKDGAENEVLFLDSGGLSCTVDPSLPMPIRGLRGEAYQKVKTVYHNDFSKSEWLKFMPEGHVRLDNVMFAPMVLDGKPVGLLGIANKPGGFTENDARMASTFGELAAIALQNKRAEEALRKAHDELEIRVEERTAKLQKSERKYRTLIEQAAEAIAIFDQHLNLIDVNSVACQMTGFTREELLSLNAKDLIPEEDFVSIPPQLAEVLSGKTVMNESRLRRKDGTIISIEVSAKLLEDSMVQTITRDITARNKAEERNRLIRNLLELFAKKTSRKEYLDSLVELIHNWSGCRCVGIRLVNEKRYIPYESYVGFSKEFLKLENMLSLDTDVCACIRVIEGKFESQDTPVITQNGSLYLCNSTEFVNGLTEKEKTRYRGNCIRSGFLSVAIIPIRYHEQTLGAIHLTDEREGMVPLNTIQFLELMAVPLIGEAIHRFNTEEALKASEASLYEAQRVAHLGNWDWNIQTNQLYWSDEIYRIFGLSPQEFGATYDAFLDSVHPDDREFVKRAVSEALYEKKPYSIDHRIVLSDGSVRIVHEQAEVTSDEAGNPVRMLGTVQDITDLKMAEQELKKSYEQLRNLSEHLQSVREEERTKIAREIHDELGQTLTALKIEISMLAGKLYPDHKPLVEKTESIVKRIDETIQAVKRICTELRPTVLDHFGLIAAIEWQAEEFQKRTGIRCEVTFTPGDIVFDQDTSTVLFRIFQETLTNVMRHADAAEVKASLKEKDGMITLEVKDNGRGITEEQINNSSSFGLLGIRERVNFLGGNVTISGMGNKGTTVKVSIPYRKK